MKISNGCSDVNVGIIEADKCEAYQGKMWWTEAGISYFSNDGQIYQYDEITGLCKYHLYGEGFGDEESCIMDIWLDMNDKYQLSFAMNQVEFGTAANVKGSMKYRLAVCIYKPCTRIELLSSNIQS